MHVGGRCVLQGDVWMMDCGLMVVIRIGIHRLVYVLQFVCVVRRCPSILCFAL